MGKFLECGAKQFCNVISFKDRDDYLDRVQRDILKRMLKTIQSGRLRQHKPVNEYIVINADEPYADEVIAVLKAHGHWG